MNNPDPPVFIFTSAAFVLGEDPGSAPPGKDLAEFLRARLTATSVKVDSLVQATEGWELDIEIERRRFLVYVHWAPIADGGKDHWIIQVREPGSFKNLFGFGARGDGMKAAVRTISGALSGRSEIQGGRWVADAEFRALY